MLETAGMIDLRKRMLKYVRQSNGMLRSDIYWQEVFNSIINQHPDDPMQWLEDHINSLIIMAHDVIA